MVVDFLAMATQRWLAIIVSVIGITLRHLTQRRFALNLYEILIVINAEGRLSRIDDLPNNDGGYFDGVSVAVVDLQLAAFKIARAQGNPAPGAEWIGPAQPLQAHSAGISTEQLQHLPFIWGNLE